MKMSMAYDCHSIPADCAKVALDEGEGTGNLLCFISRFFGLKMSYFHNDAWKEDLQLKEDLQKYVGQLFKREEILSFVIRDYSCYTWSVRSLDRRLRHFDIFYSDKDVTVDYVRQAVAEEMDGPGKLLGYRAMQKKIRQEHELNVPRDLVHAVMYDLDPEGLEARSVGAKKRKPKGHFTTKGPNFVHSVDGHDKLMGYQNSTYPLAI